MRSTNLQYLLTYLFTYLLGVSLRSPQQVHNKLATSPSTAEVTGKRV